IFSVLTYLTSVVFTILCTKWSFLYKFIKYFYGQEKITVLLISLSLFMAFVTLKMKYHKWINIIASATFGVYLIHDNTIIRSLLWIDIFKNAQYQNSLMIIPYSIIAVVIVYVICTIIDLIRANIFERPYMALVNRYSDSLIKPFTSICDFFKNIIFGK
ncbi:MAG: hypothetical protein ACI31Q_01850, partial [Erysipelotrichaceae bacterium]